jgi:hypothetical protein
VLVHQPGQGRPLHRGKELEELLQFAMAQRPADFGYAATGWSVPLLQDLLASIEPEQSLSCATIRRRLQSLGYVWKRSRYVLAPDPELEKKTAPSSANPGFARAQRAPGTGRDRSAALSSTACWLGTARRAAAPVPISGHNARRSVFGTLHLRTGRALFLEQQRRRAEEFQAFLELIHWHYRAWPVALLLDENSSHTAQASQALAEELGIRLLWLRPSAVRTSTHWSISGETAKLWFAPITSMPPSTSRPAVSSITCKAFLLPSASAKPGSSPTISGCGK